MKTTAAATRPSRGNSAESRKEKSMEKVNHEADTQGKVKFITSKKDEKSIKNLAKCATGHKSRIPKRKRIKGETGNLSDLYTYISNRNQFPNERDYDKCYFNESSFTFHTDPAFLDPMKKPVVDLTKDVYKRNIKDDPLDIKNKDKFALEKKLA